MALSGEGYLAAGSAAAGDVAAGHAGRLPTGLFDKAAALLAIVAIGVVVLPPMLSEPADDQAGGPAGGAAKASAVEPAPVDASTLAPGKETFIGAYSGMPYTYNSDFKFKTKANGRDLILRNVGWDSKPFKSPIYYGVRVARWSGKSAFGGMLDFTHGKVYSQRQQEVRLDGDRGSIIPGKILPPKAKIKDIFHHFEFTHGHNMLTLNGLYRLPQPHARLKPYIGIGFGVALPHSEVQFKGSKVRTYEYQYVGPVFQALIGLEFRVPRISYFFEYKFTLARYEVPLSNRDGSLLPLDLYAQFKRWWSGKTPEGGYAWTTLVSHQLIGGMGVRIAAPVAAPLGVN